ncbi:MAG: proton-conducting transporter membrane subunit [Pseudomonadota bacterium]
MEHTLLLAPLIGACITGLAWRTIGEAAAQWTATFLMLVAAIIAWFIALNVQEALVVRDLYTWIESGSLSAAFAFRLDRDTVPLLVLVTNIAALLHVVALVQMRRTDPSNEKAKPVPGQDARLCSGIGTMTTAMLLLIVADDLAQFLAGWVLVGFATYILTGLVARKPAAGKAALRVALTLRAGELVLLIVLGFVFALTDTIRFDEIFQALPDLEQVRLPLFALQMPATELIAAGIGLACLIMGAQAVFFGWFSDATTSPLPGAVMIVAAGPVLAASALLVHMGPILGLAPVASWWLVAGAVATTVIASTSAIAQSDPLRVVACLASAQFGFVLSALGLGASQAAMAHLVSAMAALAALSLAVGIATDRGAKARDLDDFGALGRAMPAIFAASVLAAASFTALGLPGSEIGLSGYSSMTSVFSALSSAPSQELFWTGVVALSFCSFAAWRLVFRVFLFARRGSGQVKNPAPSGKVLNTLVVAFATVSVLPALFATTSQPDVSSVWVGLASLIGLGLALVFAALSPGFSDRMKNAVPWAHNVLLNGWYMVALLRLLVVAPLDWLTSALSRTQIDESGDPARVGALRLAPVLAEQANRLQGGLLAGYGVALGIGIVVLIVWIVLLSGAG